MLGGRLVLGKSLLARSPNRSSNSSDRGRQRGTLRGKSEIRKGKVIAVRQYMAKHKLTRQEPTLVNLVLGCKEEPAARARPGDSCLSQAGLDSGRARIGEDSLGEALSGRRGTTGAQVPTTLSSSGCAEAARRRRAAALARRGGAALALCRDARKYKKLPHGNNYREVSHLIQLILLGAGAGSVAA